MNTKNENQSAQDLPPSEIDGSINRIIKSFITDRKSQGLSPKTIILYSYQLKNFYMFIRNYSVNMMEEIQPEHIREYLIELSTHRNRGGVHMAYRIIKTFTYWYEIETDNQYRSPIRKVKSPKNLVPVIPGVPIEDVSKMLTFCNKRDKAMILTMIDTGVRASELISISLADLHIYEGRIHIVHGKGAKERDVFIGKKTRLAINSYLKSRSDRNKSLFITDDNESMSPNTLKLILRRRARDAGVPIPSPHDFRRAFAITCLRNHIDVESLRRLMGHSTYAVLQRYIVQNSDDIQQAHRLASPTDNL